MTGYTGRLACPRCGAETGENDAYWGCPRCADDGIGVNLQPVYEVGGELRTVDQPGLFRYRQLLPLPPEAPPVSLGEGDTPLVPVRGGRVFVKDESQNPTWSYKDRLAAVAVTHARARGAGTVVVATTGNHGAATAAYAAAAGLRCVVLTLTSVPETMKLLMQVYGASVVALDTSAARWDLLRAVVRSRGWMPTSGLVDPPIGSNPFGVDGYGTIAYELVDQLGGAPDVVVVPVAYGDGLAGIARGFAHLVAMGRIERSPRMVAAEPLGPYGLSLQRRIDKPARVEPRPSVAFSIASPIATYQGVATLRSTGGTAVTVADDEILAAQRTLAETEGLFVEASAAISMPAVDRLVASGEIGQDDVVVCVATSGGLKDMSVVADVFAPVPTIGASLAELDDAIGTEP